MERRILHCDMNNFYASVECMLDMSLRDKPVAVCGSVEERHGIVLAKNYNAKAFGVSTGEAVWQAQQKCKNLVVVSPHYEEYIKFSKLARDIYRRYTDLIQPFGMDECWLDVSGSGIYGNGYDIANEIRETIKFELGLTISVGVSFNKIFAKLGSDMKKPDAVTCIDKDTFREKIWSLPASDLLGVGRATKATLDEYGILTIGDLANTPPSFLKGRFGKNGILLHTYANGEDISKVTPDDYKCPIKSIGHGITTLRDLERKEDVWPVMLELSQEIGHKLRIHELCASGVAICVRDNELRFQQWQQQFSVATNSASYIAKTAFELFNRSYRWQNDIRSVTVRAINLIPQGMPQQLDFFSNVEKLDKMERIDLVVDNIRQRFGRESIKNAILCKDISVNSKTVELVMPTGMCR